MIRQFYTFIWNAVGSCTVNTVITNSIHLLYPNDSEHVLQTLHSVTRKASPALQQNSLEWNHFTESIEALACTGPFIHSPPSQSKQLCLLLVCYLNVTYRREMNVGTVWQSRGEEWTLKPTPQWTLWNGWTIARHILPKSRPFNSTQMI